MKAYLEKWIKRYFSDPQVIILGFLLILAFVLFYTLGSMLIPVFVAIVIAYILDGLVDWLEVFRVPRKAAVITVFLFFIAVLIALFTIFLPLLSRQIAQLFQELPSMITKGQKELLLLPQKYPDFISEERMKALFTMMGTGLSNIGDYIVQITISGAMGIITLMVYLILVPFLVFFFLKDKEEIFAWIKSLLPEDLGLTTKVWIEANQQASNYIRGKVWEIIIVWAVSYGTFTLMGLKFSIVLSLFVGLSVLAPYIGVTVMFIPIAIVSLFQWGPGAHTFYVLFAYGIIQVIDGNILAPLLLSEVVNIHPVAIIIAILVFGGLWGIWGLIFAIPLATLFHAVLKAWMGSILRETQP
ncbi:MAG TPA: AI-2E family transporter [Deltaproteobacteria bacterium]|nr:AI-2E family transporter [Deltaproteobacteria bacterium]